MLFAISRDEKTPFHLTRCSPQKATWVYDLGSTAGTFLNGERISKKAPIIDRNKLKAGPVELTVTTDSYQVVVNLSN